MVGGVPKLMDRSIVHSVRAEVKLLRKAYVSNEVAKVNEGRLFALLGGAYESDIRNNGSKRRQLELSLRSPDRSSRERGRSE